MPLTEEDARKRVTSLKDAHVNRRSAEIQRQTMATSFFRNRHWQRAGANRGLTASGGYSFPGAGVNYSPDRNHLRVINNFITPTTQTAEAATRPIHIPVEVRPRENDTTPTTRQQAKLAKRMFDWMQPRMRVDSSLAYANFMASICGAYVVIVEVHRFDVETGVKPPDKVATEETSTEKVVVLGDWAVRWSTIPSPELILDTANDRPNLDDHEEVVLRWVISTDKARTMYGLTIDDDRAQTIGEIASNYVQGNVWSGGILYSDFMRYSSTKGVEIFQYYRRSDPGGARFDEAYIFARSGGILGKDGQPLEDKMLLLNADGANFYGGNGLPIGLYNYYWMPGTPYGTGVTGMLLDDQRRLNLHETLRTRGLAISAMPRWMIDRRSMSRQEWEQNMANGSPFKPIFYKGAMRQQGVAPPSMMSGPEPSPQHTEQSFAIQNAMTTKSHRSQMNLGIGKSHVPDATSSRLLEESDKVPNLLVEATRKMSISIVEVTIGTLIRAIQQGAVNLIGDLVNDAKFTEEEIMALRSIDPDRLPFDVDIPRDSLRPESTSGKMARLSMAVAGNNPTLTPDEYRFALVNDVSMPLTQQDRLEIDFAQEVAFDVIEGIPWPGQDGLNNRLFGLTLRAAIARRPGPENEEARQRLAQAVDVQNQIANRELAEQQAAQQGEPTATQTPVAGGVDLSGVSASQSPESGNIALVG